MLDKVLDKIKEIIDIEKFDDDDTKTLVDKNFVMLIACIIKDDGKTYQQLFLEKTLFTF